MSDDRPDGYHEGFDHGLDHGVRLRADQREPVTNCTVCGEDHTSGFPSNQVIYRGTGVVMNVGDFVTHG